MSRVGSLSPAQLLTGPLFNEPMRIETVQPNGPASWAVGLVGTQSERFRKVTLTVADHPARGTIRLNGLHPHGLAEQRSG